MSTQFVERLNQWASDPRNIEAAREACPTHVLMHGTMGFAFGGFLGMFLASMSGGAGAPEARLLSGSSGLASDISTLPIKTQMRMALSDMAVRSWSSAKNFGKIAAIFSGAECIIEGVIRRPYPCHACV
jgi:import inner membrane translocase subunit TIM22